MIQPGDWQTALQKAVRKNKRVAYSRFLQMATVDTSGSPKNRTLVFRGMSEDKSALVMVTDRRSEKITELQNQPKAEICWYFTESREQFRFSGEVEVFDKDSQAQALRQSHWEKLSPMAKTQFFWPHPTAPRDPEQQHLYQQASNHISDISREFCLLLFSPQRVEHLMLRGNPQHRFVYQLDQQRQWHCLEVNP